MPNIKKILWILVDFLKFFRIIYIRMDMRKNGKTTKSADVATLSDKKFVVGAKQLRKAVRSKIVVHVFIASNADPAITTSIEQLCIDNSISYTWVNTMNDLGRACGIEVGATTAAVVA